MYPDLTDRILVDGYSVLCEIQGMIGSTANSSREDILKDVAK